MNQRVYHVFIDQDGVRGVFDAEELEQPQVLISSVGGKQTLISRDILQRRKDGIYYVPVSLNQLHNQQSDVTSQTVPLPENVEAVLPIIAEEINVYKRWVETDVVRVSKVIHEEEQLVNESLLKEEVTVEHVPINLVIDQPVQTRYEGETLIIPLIEEVLVVEKRYLLKEEVRVMKRQVQVPTSQTVTVRKEEAIVQRIDKQGNPKPE